MFSQNSNSSEFFWKFTLFFLPSVSWLSSHSDARTHMVFPQAQLKRALEKLKVAHEIGRLQAEGKCTLNPGAQAFEMRRENFAAVPERAQNWERRGAHWPTERFQWPISPVSSTSSASGSQQPRRLPPPSAAIAAASRILWRPGFASSSPTFCTHT